MALKIRQNLFSDDSVITSMTHEDLAYAIYVRDYSIGNFEEARFVEFFFSLLFLKEVGFENFSNVF